jgi:hypothetical protein
MCLNVLKKIYPLLMDALINHLQDHPERRAENMVNSNPSIFDAFYVSASDKSIQLETCKPTVKLHV